MSRSSERDWLHPRKLEYVPLNAELAVVRLVAGLDRGSCPPPDTALVAGAPHSVVRAPVLGSVTHRPSKRTRTADHLLWRVTFALPLELLECPQAMFALTARDHMPRRLPDPELSSIEALCRHWDLGPRGAGLLGGLALRRAAALGTAVAVAGSSVLPPAVALATNHAHSGSGAAATSPLAHTAAAGPAATGSSHTGHIILARSVASQTVGFAQTQTGGSAQVDLAKPAAPHHRRHHHHHHKSRLHVVHRGGSSSTSTKPAQSQSSGGVGSPVLPTKPAPTAHNHRHRHHRDGGKTVNQAAGSGVPTPLSSAPPGTLVGNHQSVGSHNSGQVDNPAGHHRTGHHQTGSTTRKHHHGHHHHHHPGHHRAASRPAISGGASLPTLKPSPASHLPRPGASEPPSQPVGTPTPSSFSGSSANYWTTGMGMSPGEVALLSHLSGLYSKGLQPPKVLIPIYKAAGKRFHIPWQVLAGINSIETNYGRDLNTSSAGAVGWMQFMPATWAEYGMAIKDNGPPNPYDPTDAIFSAAHYLAANGGAKHLRKAIFAYNHATWYVDSVLWRAGIISEHAQGTQHLGGYALPLDGKYMHVFGRTDDGLDIEDAPDGAAVYSITPGVVTAVADDPNGFGPNYPVIRVTKGPLAGQYIYYGHVAASLVKVGQHVVAGQPIAVMGHTGDAASLGHGHIEIGFSDSAGDPLNHHGPVAWTPSGSAMRRVLVALAHGFHIKVR